MSAARSEELSFQVEVDGAARDEMVIRVIGDLDFTVAPLLANAGVTCTHAHRVVVDLAGVAFLDSFGAECLCALADRVRVDGGIVVVSRASARARRTLQLLRIDPVSLVPAP